MTRPSDIEKLHNEQEPMPKEAQTDEKPSGGARSYEGLQAAVRKVWKKLPRSWRRKYLQVEASTAEKLEEVHRRAVRRHRVTKRWSRRNRRRLQEQV